jgi:hypothetical protein
VDKQNGDATLLRPALDPAIPPAARTLLLAPGAPLTPACQPRPARGRGLLPLDPQQRLAAVYDGVTGLTVALFVAITGTTPWAIGVLIFLGPAGWASATGHYALVLVELIVAVTAVVCCARVARSARGPAAARTYHGRYLTGDDFDAPARVLLRRTQVAVDAVTSAEVNQAGFLDESPVLADQEWDIALSLREQARLRGKRAEIPEPAPGTPAAELLRQHRDAAQAAEQSITDRISAFEQYAAEVRGADAAYRDWRQHTTAAGLADEHLDMLARTAADEHGTAELNAMTERARALRITLRET